MRQAPFRSVLSIIIQDRDIAGFGGNSESLHENNEVVGCITGALFATRVKRKSGD
jgi:hypothetical protein